MAVHWLVRVGSFGMALLFSSSGVAQDKAFDRSMKAWDQANPEPRGRSESPEAIAALWTAMDRACAGEKARLEATYTGGGGHPPGYDAAFDANAECRDKAGDEWLQQNDAGYRAHRQWSNRRQEHMDDASLLSEDPLPSSKAASGGAVLPLRPTNALAAHNPAGEAADCIRVIYAVDFEVEHVSSTQKAAFRNRCSKPVEVVWCTLSGDCRPGYSNLATVPARKDRGFSYEPSVVGSKVAYAACYNGFVQHQADLSKKLLHACK